jgi:hypothetical protein
MLSEWSSFPLATITFLGEQQDIIGPEAAILVAGQMTEIGVVPHELELVPIPRGHVVGTNFLHENRSPVEIIWLYALK